MPPLILNIWYVSLFISYGPYSLINFPNTSYFVPHLLLVVHWIKSNLFPLKAQARPSEITLWVVSFIPSYYSCTSVSVLFRLASLLLSIPFHSHLYALVISLTGLQSFLCLFLRDFHILLISSWGGWSRWMWNFGEKTLTTSHWWVVNGWVHCEDTYRTKG